MIQCDLFNNFPIASWTLIIIIFGYFTSERNTIMKIIIGISGASGVIMGERLLRALKGNKKVETHLIITESAKKNFALETDLNIKSVLALSDYFYASDDMSAKIASGTYDADAMIVIPCSMKSLAGIVSGYSDNLLLRAADVTLKERRPLILVPREMPLSRLHLKNLAAAADLGAVIIPPMLTFYSGAETVESQIDNVIGRTLMQLGIEYKKFHPWEGKKVVKSPFEEIELF